MCYGDKEGDFMEFVAFYLGDINIYWYGLIIVFALLIGLGISKIMFKFVCVVKINHANCIEENVF